jgi:hypothetical protein
VAAHDDSAQKNAEKNASLLSGKPELFVGANT